MTAGPSNVPENGVRAANAHGVPVPSEEPMEGTSEERPAIAPEGRADGETDVSMPGTTSF